LLGYRDNGDVIVANSRAIKPSADEGLVAVSIVIGDRDVANQVVRMAVKRCGRSERLINSAATPGPEVPTRCPESIPATPACHDA
jgi:hypothetical protein